MRVYNRHHRVDLALFVSLNTNCVQFVFLVAQIYVRYNVRLGVRNDIEQKRRKENIWMKKLLSRLDQMAHDFYMYITTVG